MQVSVENTSDIGRRLTVNIPLQMLKTEIDDRMNTVLRTQRIDGFRPGKAPKNLIAQKFGPQIRHDAVTKLIETTLPSVLQKEALEPAGTPELEKVSAANEDDKDLTYVVHFEIFPEVELPDLKKIEINKFEVKITEKDVDQALEKVRHQLGTWHVVERPAKLGDRLIVDYTSLLNGKPYENNSGKQVTVELGTKLFIEGFEEGLIGAKTGETRSLSLTFPAEWRIEALAGKPVDFSITVHEISEKELPACDKTLANRIGADVTSETDELEAIRNKVRHDLQVELDRRVAECVKRDVMDTLLKEITISIPKALIRNEMAALHEDLHRRMGDKGEHHSCEHHGMEEEAKRRVSVSLILKKIIQLEALKPSDEKVKEKISALAASFGNAEFIESMYYKSEELLSSIRNSVLVEQTIDWVLSQVSVISKHIDVEELLNRPL